MAVKKDTKSKSKAKSTSKPKVKPKAATKAKPKTKATMKKTTTTKNVKKKVAAQPETATMLVKKAESAKTPPTIKAVTPVVVKRTVNPPLERRRPMKKRMSRGNQFNFMKAPGLDHDFEVGDTVEVFCDHEKNRDRIRGWVKGIIVQVDHKLAAVQFRSNVYLTDGWMVPDRILWFPTNSEHIRPVAGGKKSVAKKDFIPDY